MTSNTIHARASSDTVKETVHILPCEIEHTGHAKVAGLFHTRSCAETNTLQATFRGRGLKGVAANLPSEYKGIDFELHARVFSDQTTQGLVLHQLSNDQRIASVASFDVLHVWAHDEVPTEQHDPVLRGLAWIQMQAHVIFPLLFASAQCAFNLSSHPGACLTAKMHEQVFT
ncbi:ribonuclease H2 non-catalytic subunit-domain-containing protein [Chytriomyces cf. hyalinus JEL632]|nr:ribonuclease H2 non-catalytic subunit-domain-containing protein [Chytriomyces cf. hyalinus JEL632]